MKANQTSENQYSFASAARTAKQAWLICKPDLLIS